MKIFFSNPKKQNIKKKKKLVSVFKNVINQSNYIIGKQNIKFEKNINNFFNSKYSLGVNSGTDALKIAIKSLELKNNSEIIIPSLTATATGAAVLEAGAKPVLSDVDETGNLDLIGLKKNITKKTKAIIVVHLHGNMADIRGIMKIAGKIPIIEDCAQSFGSSLKNKKAGTFGKIACFSFYPTKNLAAIGDGGALITNNKNLYLKMLSLRQYGWDKNRISKQPGYNSRLDEIQAAILNIKFKLIKKNNLKRNILAKRYIKSLSDLPIFFPKSIKGSFHSYHLFVIITKKRNKLLKFLRHKQIIASIHYKNPLHKMPSFSKYIKKKPLNAEKLSNSILSLPIYPELSYREQNKVINAIRNFFKKNS